MTDLQLLAYVFATFVVGTGCVGAGLALARLRHDELARAFLVLYLPFSVMVLAALLLAFVETGASPSPWTMGVLEYLEAFVGRYGVMLALPVFAHWIFGVRDRRRTAVLVTIVLGAFGAQHLTEFVLGEAWDFRGDVAEDVLFGAVVLYTLAVSIRRLEDNAVYRPLGRRFLILLLLGLPVIGHDLVFADGPGLRLYPVWYCALGVVMVFTLARRRRVAGGAIPREWGLTPREEELVRLVQRGLSNREIAMNLSVSVNTVKTHLQAVFDKSGFHSRVALIATLATRE